MIVYHSNCKIPAIVGIMEIVKEHSPDKSALDPKHPYYDPKEKADAQKWCVVHVEHRLTLDTPVRLKDLQQYKNPGQPLADMQMLKQTRLSVSKVSRKEWNYILALAEVGGKWKATVKNEAKS
jgi:predicted RNA-binding protein with PUA-like domain